MGLTPPLPQPSADGTSRRRSEPGSHQLRPADQSRPDDAVLAEIIRLTFTDVWRLHAHQIGREDADDLAQETYLRVTRALPGFRRESSLRVWVLSIASRVAADEIRRRQRSRRLLGRLRPAPETVADEAGSRDLLDLLARLDPARREAFVLTQVLELSYDEAAQLVGCPIGTIRSRVARARADLIAAFAD